jgi:hypothetical protein
MTTNKKMDSDTDSESITLTVEINPEQFDEPRQMMFERLVEEYGHETVAELVGANLQQDLTAQGMHIINAMWDNRDQIQVEPDGVETPAVPEQPDGIDS